MVNIPPIYGDLGDGLLVFYPHYIRSGLFSPETRHLHQSTLQKTGHGSSKATPKPFSLRVQVQFPQLNRHLCGVISLLRSSFKREAPVRFFLGESPKSNFWPVQSPFLLLQLPFLLVKPHIFDSKILNSEG